MADPAVFAARSPHDVLDLLSASPLAWVVSSVDGQSVATPLPLLPELDAQGRLVALVGHFARRNPQVAALQAAPQALVLLMGPQGYVSPSWMADRTQAPSWNYASAQVQVHVNFMTDAALLAHLRALADTHEAGRSRAWSVDDMGPRLHQLAQHVVGFRAEVLGLQQRYKLGQDERDDVFADILMGLARQPGSEALVAWMRRFNPGRGPTATALDPGDAAKPTPTA